MLAKGNFAIGVEWRFGPDWPGQRCEAKTRQGAGFQGPANKKNGRCKLHGSASIGPRIPDGRERILQANMRHGRHTKETLEKHRINTAVGRALRKELRQIEQGLVKEGTLARYWLQHFSS